MKKRLFVAFVAAIILLTSAIPAFANVPTVEVSLRIEGKNSTLFYDKLSTNNQINFNVLSMLTLADTNSDAITIEGLNLGYITAINGEKIGQTAGGQDGYVVRVNGEYLPYAQLSTYTLKNGDSILVYYADEFERGMMFPIVDTDKLVSQRYLRFTYEEPSEDGKSVSNKSISGATVKWYCDDVEFVYTTDGNGGVYIDKSAFTSGKHKLALELYYEDGTPALLRLTPDYTVSVPVGIGDTFTVFICAAAMIICAAAITLLSISLKKKKADGNAMNR
jgi:sulfur carrier protein ThiS